MTGTRQITPLALLALVPVTMLLVVAQRPVEPWGDEAMLLVNLLARDLDLLAPLPFYEQAAPPGYLWLARGVLDLFGSAPPYHALRLLSTVLMVAGILVLLRTELMRRDATASVILAAFLLSSPLVWFYAAEIKHYSADFLASALILSFGLPLLRRDDWKSRAAFLAAVLVAGLLSFTVPIVAAGVLAGIATMRLLAQRRGEAAGPGLGFVLVAGIALLYLGALYLALSRSLVVYQMSAYFHVYAPEGIEGTRLIIRRAMGVFDMVVNSLGPGWLGFVRQRLNEAGLPIGLAYHAVRVLAALLFAAVLWLAARRAPAMVCITLCLYGLVALLLMAGVVSLPYERHALFLMPFSAMLVALAASVLFERSLPAGWARRVALAVLLPCLAFGIWAGLGRTTQDMGKLLAHIDETAPDVPVWVLADAQSVLQVLTPRPARVLGELDRTSQLIGWGVRGGAYLDPRQAGGELRPNPDYSDSIRRLAKDETALWLLFSQEAPSSDRTPYLAAAGETVGPCQPARERLGAALYYCTRTEAAAKPGGN